MSIKILLYRLHFRYFDYFGLYWNNNAFVFSDRLEIIDLEKSNLIKGPEVDSVNNQIIFTYKMKPTYN